MKISLTRFSGCLLMAFTLLSAHNEVRGDTQITGGRTNINPALLYWQASVLLPNLSPADSYHFQTNYWRAMPLDDRIREILERYNSVFAHLHRAAEQKEPCDWGHDLSQGPTLLLPGLSKAKFMAQLAQLRFRWHLESGRPLEASREWGSTLHLARQLSTDGILISMLVQYAIENMLISTVAENWFRLDQGTLDRIEASIQSAPPPGRFVRCVETERTSFRDWLVTQIQNFRASSPDDTAALTKLGECLHQLDDTDPESGRRIIQAFGGTSAGVLQGLKDLDPAYDRIIALGGLPFSDYVKSAETFWAEVDRSTNRFAPMFLKPLSQSKLKEFKADTRMAILRAAIAFRRNGEAGLRSITDPLTGGTFELRRSVFEGVDRGFQIRSRADHESILPWQTFLESDGPAFYLDGPNAGKAVTKN